jgi:hypothetical protein
MKAEGVWRSTVTPLPRRKAWNATGSRRVAYGTTARCPPWSRALHISKTETSKANEWNIEQTSVWPKRNQCAVAVSRRETLSC